MYTYVILILILMFNIYRKLFLTLKKVQMVKITPQTPTTQQKIPLQISISPTGGSSPTHEWYLEKLDNLFI